MEKFLYVFVLIPTLGFLLNWIVPRRKENWLARIAFGTMGLQFLYSSVFLALWIFKGSPELYSRQSSILHEGSFDFFMDFMFDLPTSAFLMTGSLIAFLITKYSVNYLHKEPGFKRFFTTIMLFYLGYNLIVLSGNITTVFIGWEIVGISSFLLIAFYRNRYIPVKNAVKIFSIYRLGDIMLLVGIWASHHLWHKTIVFNDFANAEAVKMHIADHYSLTILFCICIVIAAAIKSGQLPFSPWVPKALEGPTPSSGIFYTSLAVHLGVLLLIRTYDFWCFIPGIRILIIVLGACTFLITTSISRYQSNIKGQIAYAGLAQIGLMFIEVALGWHILALIHFTSNSFLRCYQILISPSVVTYKIREQFYGLISFRNERSKSKLRNKLSNTLYILNSREWYLDDWLHRLLWGGFKRLGRLIGRINDSWFNRIVVLLCLVLGFLTLYRTEIEGISFEFLAFLAILLALVMSLKAFTEREKVFHAIMYVFMASLLILVSISFLHSISSLHILFFVAGIVFSSLIVLLAFSYLNKRESKINLKGYQGHCYEYPFTELLFMIGAIGLYGFPVSSVFIGIELLVGYLEPDDYWILGTMMLVLFINALSMIRVYTRLFLGPHIKTYHAWANRSA